jgi:hypothetical protein
LPSPTAANPFERSPAIAQNSSDATDRLHILRRCSEFDFPIAPEPEWIPAPRFRRRCRLDRWSGTIIVFTIGAAASEDDARRLVQRFRGEGNAQAALEGVWHYWSQTLGVVHVETPDPAVNFLANGWLVYQTLACRMWARTGFYQSGGAYGFRDQLQDAMALIHASRDCCVSILLRACSRQFREGDVQHWWHPPAGRGVRTKFLRRLPLAARRVVSLRADDGRHRHSGRTSSVPHVPARCMLMKKPTMTCRQ